MSANLPRVVADTNVLVSGICWSGPAARILDAITEGRLQLIQTPPLLAELRRVLAYPKLARAIPDPDGTAALIESVADLVTPELQITAIADEADNRVLEAAVAAQAGHIISGDHHLLELGAYDQIPILTPAAFCARVLEASGG